MENVFQKAQIFTPHGKCFSVYSWVGSKDNIFSPYGTQLLRSYIECYYKFNLEASSFRIIHASQY